MNLVTKKALFQDEHLTVGLDRSSVWFDSKKLVMTQKEYELLLLLVRNEAEIISRADLLMQVWGYSTEIRTRTLDVHIRRLRSKLAPYSRSYIETVFGVGYRFQRYRAERPVLQGLLPAPVMLPMTA